MHSGQPTSAIVDSDSRNERDMPTPAHLRIIWYNAAGDRYCTRCAAYMTVELFPRNRAAGTPDGLGRRCRLCVREERHASYQRHREREIARSLAWQAAHPERVRVTRRLAGRVYALRMRLKRQTVEG